MSEYKTRLARVAISNGLSRSEFVGQQTGHWSEKPVQSCPVMACQWWSAAYDEALQKIRDEVSFVETN